MEQVPFIDLKRQYNTIRSEVLPAVEKVLQEGSFILGEHVEHFEKSISNYLGQSSLGCASGTDAILLALMAIGIKEDDEVITTPFTFFATAGTIARLGAKPVFVDIDPVTYNIAPEKIEGVITERTKAIIVVHLFGQSASMEEILRIAHKHNIKVIEDACQSFGAEYKGKKLGTIGDFGCYSFFPTKNLGGAGDGGLVTSSSADYLHLMKKLRVHGSEKKYFNEYVGINSRLDAIQAAILTIKLPYIDEWNQKRRKIATQYNQELKDLVSVPAEHTDEEHIFHQYVIRLEKRDELLSYLQEQGVAAGVYYPLSLHEQPCFGYLGYHHGDFPVSERMCKDVLSLPIFPEMTEQEIAYVITTTKNFFQRQ